MTQKKEFRGMASILVVLAALFVVPFFFGSCTSDYDFEEAFVPEKIFVRDTIHIHNTETIIKKVEIEGIETEYINEKI